MMIRARRKRVRNTPIAASQPLLSPRKAIQRRDPVHRAINPKLPLPGRRHRTVVVVVEDAVDAACHLATAAAVGEIAAAGATVSRLQALITVVASSNTAMVHTLARPAMRRRAPKRNTGQNPRTAPF